MSRSTHRCPTHVSLLLALAAITTAGCSRTTYRLDADREANDVIAQRSHDPRWHVMDYRIDLDPRSRFFDPHHPDRPPMPPDNPASHRYMHVVDGMHGPEHSNGDGRGGSLENPAWQESLAEYVNLAEDGSVRLDLDPALKLAYIHSPSHRFQQASLYLSALDVTTERFRLDTQLFGGYDADFAHLGSLIPPSIGRAPTGGVAMRPPTRD